MKWIRTALVVSSLPLLAACAVIVDPESLLIRCDMDLANQGRDPCQSVGQQCMNGTCRPCDPDARELCNGRDDDCDGEIDEGHDADGDGFTWCGGGRVELADCVDSDAKIHPPPIDEDGAVGRGPDEACDGKDNDCDSKVDEDRSKCMNTTPNCTKDSCPTDRICDEASGVCIVPRAVGSGCTSDSDCKAGFCLHPGSFNLPVSLMDNRCASACCSNADCGEGSSCVIARSGARVCLPNNIASFGTKELGGRCSMDDECKTGFCARGECQAHCVSSSQCPNAECILGSGSANDVRTFLCSEPVGRIESGEQCLTLGCRTNFCTEEFTCATPCARDTDCEKTQYCKYVEVRPTFGGPASLVSLCVTKPTAGAMNDEPTEHLCCTNDDCGGSLCAPNSPRANVWNMTCRSGEQLQ